MPLDHAWILRPTRVTVQKPSEQGTLVGMSVTTLFSSDKYTYRLLWDEVKERYLGVCSEFPDLKYEATSTSDALAGIQNRIAEEVTRLTRLKKTVPEPLAVRRFGP